MKTIHLPSGLTCECGQPAGTPRSRYRCPDCDVDWTPAHHRKPRTGHRTAEQHAPGGLSTPSPARASDRRAASEPFPAHHGSRCPVCDGQIIPGDLIVYLENADIVHTDCADPQENHPENKDDME